MSSRAGTRNFRISHAIPENYAGRTVAVKLEVEDAGGNTQVSPLIQVHVRRDLPPQVLITGPQHGAALVAGTKAQVEMKAFDDVGLAGVELSIDGKVVTILTGQTLEYHWNIPSADAGK